MPFQFLLLSSSSSSSHFLSHSKALSVRSLILPPSTMSISLSSHAFAGNPTRLKTPKSGDPFSPASAFQTLKSILLSRSTQEPSSPDFKVLPFRKGRPLVGSNGDAAGSSGPNWHLVWLSFGECRAFLENSEVNLGEDSLVYLGFKAEDDVVFWAIDVSEASDDMVSELGSRQFCFVELMTLMVATDWADPKAMGDLSVAGHARALLEWHSSSRFCGYCGAKTVPMEAGRRKSCSNESCKRRIYPRVDPAVIMLVVDKENGRALLSRQSRLPRMWSCLAGFIEPGETLEEAVRRETWEEAGIEVGEVVCHSSQPWPVGPSGIPCQLMVGFYAYAKSLEINVDKKELEDAKWYSREDVKKALTLSEYKKAQSTAAAKVDQMCKGVEKGQSLSADFNVESGELATMFIPGPFAIAHHLISSWANQTVVNGAQTHSKPPAGKSCK